MKNTNSKLLTSVLTLVMCIGMLFGTTFAWFTDSASTGVNKIQAGKLDVTLEMKNPTVLPYGWEDAEEKVLNWEVTDGRNPDEILWEPGATYTLPTLKITNKGNLALQYKILINGVVGDLDLLNALEFTFINDGMTEDGEESLQTIDGSVIKNAIENGGTYELPGDLSSISVLRLW